ncbi:RHS repeat-associated core domain-containing protein [Acidipropionibacterium jensenii]|uniref:RHS repeat-associated core domain-containing protein n=1 Tax=Acidipropionibacterium jensenii TaxID=1749 RepID=UPI00214C735D|nr:RHS repeat-associated core domain-containing protein [Acidipropionibacterium jensenii]
MVTAVVAGALAITCMPTTSASADPGETVRKKRPSTAGMALSSAKPVAAGTDLAAKVPAMRAWKASAAAMPRAGTATVAPQSGMVRAGSLAVRLGPGRSRTASRKVSAAPSAVTVTSHAPATTAASGGRSWMVGLQAASAGDVTVSLDTGWLGTAASRALLMRLPACALTTPETPACQQGTPVAVERTGAEQVSATMALAAGQTVLAMTSGASGATGDAAASPLSSASSWEAGGSSGDFTWNYPISTMPLVGGVSPTLALGYSSASVDGRTVATNNQTSWVGEGWDLSNGFIERGYVRCADDMTGSNTTAKTGDLCWNGANATASFGAHSGELVQDGTSNRWRLRNDDGTRFELLTGAVNGDNDGEYWKVTIPDGTRLWFGKGSVGSENTVTNSAWTAPVFGNQTGEPCHQSTYAASACTQAWRWNLDYVVDAHGNAMAATYTAESNRYGQNLNAKSVAYVRGGYLTRILHGFRDGAATTTAGARVEFGVADRCLDGAACGSAPTTANASHWPDVPVDQICTSTTTCPTLFAPTFFTTKRLSKISAQIRSSATGYTDVDVYTLTHTFPNPGDGTAPALWLSKVDHTGAGGALPDGGTTFVGQAMANRVDGVEDTTGTVAAPFYKYRIVSVTEPGGGQTFATYAAADCTPASVKDLKPESSTKRCFPTWWTPPGATEPVLTWFHRYPVTRVARHDLTAATTPDVETNYTYGTPGWRYDDSPLTTPKYRTWSQFAGYGTVTTITGRPADANSLRTDETYYRGINGDRAGPSGGTKTASVASTYDGSDSDDWWKAGTLRQTTTYNGVSGATAVEVDATTVGALTTTVTSPAGRKAGYTPTVTSAGHTILAAGGTRSQKIATGYDQYGNTISSDDTGDTSKSGDERCAKVEYATSALGVANVPKWSGTRGVSCGSWASAADGQILQDAQYYYDGQAWGTATTGSVTRIDSLSTASGTTLTRATTAKMSYDSLGRPTSTTDSLGNVTTIGYSADATTGLVTGQTLTSPDPDGAGALKPHVTTTTLDPRFATPAKVVEPGGETTETVYDALGREVSVWLPGRSKTTYPSAPSVTYAYQMGGTSTPAATTTTTLKANGQPLVSVELFDGLGRSRQTQRQTIDRQIDASGNPVQTTGRLVSGTRYDARGLQTVESGAVLKSGAPAAAWVQVLDSEVDSQTVTDYDGAGRTIASSLYTKQVKKWSTTAVYGGDRTTVTPPAGAMPSTDVTDIRGQLVQHIGYKTASLTGASETASYTWTPAGKLASMTDAAGSTWRYSYDARGNQTRTEDPDAGVSTATFDAAGKTLTSTDANAHTLAYTYDALGRRTSLRDQAAGGNLRAEWVWDTVKPGYLTSSARVLDGGARWVQATTARDTAGRATTTQTTVPAVTGLIDAKLAGTYTQTFTYNSNGSLKRTVLPAAGPLGAEELSYGYDGADRNTVIAGGAAYVDDAVFTGDDMLTQIASGSSAGHLTWQTMDYDLASGRQTRLRLDRENAAKADADIAYRYTDSGSITSISAAQPQSGQATDTQCFTHDYNGRLSAAFTTSAAECPSTTPTTVTGPAPYSLAWTYDAAGNRTRQDNKVTGTVTTWTSPAASAARPHGATSQTVTVSGKAGVTTSFGYDQAGNVTSRTSGSVLAGTFTRAVSSSYDAENHLVAASAGTDSSRYAYDPDGDRIVAAVAGKQTIYLPGGTELSVKAGAVTAVRSYDFAGRTVARREATSTSNTLTWQWSDLNNTAGWQIDAATTSTPVVRRTDPFGGLRGASPSGWAGDRGMANGIVDTVTGTLRLGARDYDPATGRFTQPDPILDREDPTQWNAYAYGANNPVDRPDPDGLMPGSPIYCADTCQGKDAAYQIHESNSRTPYNKAAHEKDNDAHYKTKYWTPARSLYRTPAHSGKHSSASPAKKKASAVRTVSANAVGTAVQLAVDILLTAACPACLVIAGVASAIAGYTTTQLLLHQTPTVEGILAAAAIGAVGGFATRLALKALGRVAGTLVPRVNKAVRKAVSRADLEERVSVIHGQLDSTAQRMRTTAALSTKEGPTVIGSGKRDIGPGQRALLSDNEIEARRPGVHAELTVVQEANKRGLSPNEVVTSWNICPSCQSFLKDEGATITGPRSAKWN